MQTYFKNLKNQLASKLVHDTQTKLTVLSLVQHAFREISKEITKTVTSIQMLLFQRDYSDAMLRLDQLKCDWMNLEVHYKTGYDVEAQKQIKREFEKQSFSFISQKYIGGKMSHSTIKPRLSSREKYDVSLRKKKDVLNGQDAHSNNNIETKKFKELKGDQNKSQRRNKSKSNVIDLTHFGSILKTKEKKQNVNKTMAKVPSTGRKKAVFK